MSDLTEEESCGLGRPSPRCHVGGDREGLGARSGAQLHREASQLAETGKLPFRQEKRQFCIKGIL